LARLVRVECQRCHRVFLRYDYGHGKPRRHKPSRGRKPYPCASVTDSCIFCRGAVKVK